MKKVFCAVLSAGGKDLALLVLRVAAGLMMFSHGAAKIAGFSTLSATFPDPIGLGGRLSLILIICAETGASLLIVLGAFTRLAAIALMFGMCVAAFIAHAPFTFSGSELPLLYLLVFTCLLISGAGRYSADELLRRRLCKE